MRIKTRKCLYCGMEFELPHGNKDYCPGKDCDYQAKLERQEVSYTIGNDAKMAIRKNYLLFRRFAGNQKRTELDLAKLQNKGFDQFGYYRYKEISGVWHYFVHEYSFSIEKNIITIWKT